MAKEVTGSSSVSRLDEAKREREVFGNRLAQISPAPSDLEVLLLHDFYLLGIAVGQEHCSIPSPTPTFAEVLKALRSEEGG